MSTQFDVPLYGFRLVETYRGDTLQSIAARELGDASFWWRLIAYNDLIPPFITDDSTQATTGVLLTGSFIKVPAPVQNGAVTTDPDLVFEADVQLQDGDLVIENGDFAVVSGRDNLAQALKNVVETSRGELGFHPQYGSQVRRLIGAVNGPTSALLAAEYAKAAVRSDSRIQNVTTATATVNGDVIEVSVEAVPIAGRSINITALP